MLKITLFLLLLFSKVCFSQVIDNFNDGNFTQNPTWQGNHDSFLINNAGQLQSNGKKLKSQSIYLSTANSLCLNASWEFLVQLNFDPTSTNFTRIYLVSDEANLTGSLKGYFVQVGEKGAMDAFYLYRQTGKTTKKIIIGAPKARPNAGIVKAKIKVTRDLNGNWSLFTDVLGGAGYTLEGSILDKTFVQTSYFGVFCKYATASRFSQYIFDDFSVEDLTPDLIPPELKSVTVLDSLHLQVVFSEPLDTSTALLPNNYSLNNQVGHPVSVQSTANTAAYVLSFSNPLPSGKYVLAVKNIKDKKGNQIADGASKSFFYIRNYEVKRGDVVINEIFANPSNSPGLPTKEFVELWNTSDEYLLTAGWKYSDLTSTYTFKADTIAPGDYLILCARADTSLYKPFGKTIGLSPWPSLNNAGDILTLVNAKGDEINKVAYSDIWYKDEAKRRGGYSLELIDPKNVCTGIQNWAASSDASGGTPGRQNSIYRAQISSEIPKLLTANVVDSVTVEIAFSKAVDSASASKLINYQINNGVGNPVEIRFSSAMFDKAVIVFGKPLLRGKENTLSLSNVMDCAGNLINPNANSAKLFIAKAIMQNDLLISELLFNPKLNGVDFVEIYNNTNDVLDLKELQLANADANGNPASIKKVSSISVLIEPGSYWVFTTNSENITQSYVAENPTHFVQMATLPAFNNDKGTVILLSNGRLIDRFDYTEKMHNPLIKNSDGVSLERISFAEPTNTVGNFISAASSVGFATPTYKNSVSKRGDEVYVTLLSKTFSPDGDGFEDLLQLDYQFAEGEKFATVNVYSDRGILIKRLLKNQTISTKGSLTWDGLADSGIKANVGIYVVLFDVFDLSGKTRRFKKTCVLATKLN
ncbi:hypothetical protein ABIB40_003033 [Pedobacter sp. UYP30]|uniref:lamin tail domain-containing protein n=1 Tax=Pedobacter sp. UYP30 TaxID=1756400 RepID=UPI0033933499